MAKVCVWLLLFLGLQIGSVQADEIIVKPFFVNSLSEIKENHKGQEFILIFWSESCAYCMKELSVFGKLQKQFLDISIVTVSTDAFLDNKTVNDILNGKGLILDSTWVFSEEYPEPLYAAVDKGWRGELPMTCFYNRQHLATCHLGTVREADLITWIKTNPPKLPLRQ